MYLREGDNNTVSNVTGTDSECDLSVDQVITSTSEDEWGVPEWEYSPSFDLNPNSTRPPTDGQRPP